MNTLGVHALVWVGGWSHQEAERAIVATARTGFDLIEIPVLDPASVDTGSTRALLEQHGLRAGCSLGLDLGADISSGDPAVVMRGARRLANALTVTHALGADYLGGVVYSALAKYPQPSTSAGRANSVAAIRELASEASAHGIAVGLEVVNRYESNLLNTAEQAMAFIDDVGADNVVVHLDTYHMNIEETDFAAPVRTCGDRLGYVHIGESNRGYLGTGTVDFPQFFTALREAGYTGTVTFESFSSAVVHPSLSNMLAVWRNLWDDGHDLAAHALDYMRHGLAVPSSLQR
ncbi:MAG: sugar phosphate isomerase/epimerase family protein [Actinomycetota bacterium]